MKRIVFTHDKGSSALAVCWLSRYTNTSHHIQCVCDKYMQRQAAILILNPYCAFCRFFFLIIIIKCAMRCPTVSPGLSTFKVNTGLCNNYLLSRTLDLFRNKQLF